MKHIVAFAIKKVIVFDSGCVVYRCAGHDDELWWRRHYYRGRGWYHDRGWWRAEININMHTARLHPGAGEQADNKYQANGCTDNPVCHCFLQTQDVPVTASSTYSSRHVAVISLVPPFTSETFPGILEVSMAASLWCIAFLSYSDEV
jgi:hypothetical protein